jgi:hypothetical protein
MAGGTPTMRTPKSVLTVGRDAGGAAVNDALNAMTVPNTDNPPS